ncbi:(2Fe-2S)-binding protein [Tomitella gaofuii]|uniref:(2Fe-2S)-binding protein n=1 Tax=Tomitella gaofuii TaxID=2760083 RepID=UPI0015F98742|nr:(2Fe-2S)-binding protein [Tomitella gaofuii]
MDDSHDRVPRSGTPFSGALLSDDAWLARRVADTRRRWSCRDDRTAGTLWWYSAAAVLTDAGPRMLLAHGVAPDPALDRLQCTLTEQGYLGAVRADGGVREPGEYGAALASALSVVIAPLSAVSGASERALWAVASDALAGRALAAGSAAGRLAEACTLARRLTVPPLVPARFDDVVPHPDTPPTDRIRRLPADPSSPVPATGRRIVRRCSCCLIFQAPGQAKCVSCPRRSPADRDAALAAWFRSS